jgi:hypothetical protein
VSTREYPAKLFISKYPHTISILKQKKVGEFIFGFCGVIDPAETDFYDFQSDYIGEYEAICETGLAS